MQTLDVKHLQCPLPVLKARKALAGLEIGNELLVLATDKGAPEDFTHFCEATTHTLLHIETIDGVIHITIKK